MKVFNTVKAVVKWLSVAHTSIEAMAAKKESDGSVIKVSGPLVVADNMSGTKMFEARFQYETIHFFKNVFTFVVPSARATSR